MATADFAGLLKQSIGLDPASIGVSAIDRAVQERLTARQLHDRDEYWTLVRTSAPELQALIEAVVVPETWFFRDAEALAAAVRLVRDGCLVSDKSLIRIMSLPCATGEEPYSLAMALIDAGIPPHRFHIDAVDISERALDEARLGVYRKSSFRGDDLAYRARHFEMVAGGYRILPHVRGRISFRQGNLVTAENLPGMGIYDVVFCRNVLIYFDRAAQERAVGVLSRLLTPVGLLFVGPAESGVLLGQGFVSARIPKAHAFRVPSTPSAPRPDDRPRATHMRPTRPAPIAHRPSAPVTPLARPFLRAVSIETPQVIADSAPDWTAVIRLGDDRRFDAAASLCERYLREHGPSAQGFYLLGLMRDAAGQTTDAATNYRKALYLDPHHHDALVHLALLMEISDDASEAQRLRVRARRVAQQEGRS
jgi:chemotaxis protein methyltransferase WspC